MKHNSNKHLDKHLDSGSIRPLKKLLGSLAVVPVLCCAMAVPAGLAWAESDTASAEMSQAATVNINTAGAAALAQLEGVGDSKAQAIIEWREQHGEFTSLEQLTEVKGIGAATLEKNRARLSL